MIVTTDEALGVYGVLDCGAWVNNFMLAARSLGVASIAQAALGAHPQFMRAYFGLPADRLVVCGMSFGYEDAARPVNRFRTSRAAVDSVATWVDGSSLGLRHARNGVKSDSAFPCDTCTCARLRLR